MTKSNAEKKFFIALAGLRFELLDTALIPPRMDEHIKPDCQSIEEIEVFPSIASVALSNSSNAISSRNY